jgi:hypothetical protein
VLVGGTLAEVIGTTAVSIGFGTTVPDESVVIGTGVLTATLVIGSVVESIGVTLVPIGRVPAPVGMGPAVIAMLTPGVAVLPGTPTLCIVTGVVPLPGGMVDVLPPVGSTGLLLLLGRSAWLPHAAASRPAAAVLIKEVEKGRVRRIVISSVVRFANRQQFAVTARLTGRKGSLRDAVRQPRSR